MVVQRVRETRAAVFEEAEVPLQRVHALVGCHFVVAVAVMTEACFIRAEEPVQPRVQNALLVRCVGEVGVVADVHAHHTHGADDLRGGFAVCRAPAVEAVVIAHRLDAGRGLVAEDDVIALLQLCLDLRAVGWVVDVRI